MLIDGHLEQVRLQHDAAGSPLWRGRGVWGNPMVDQLVFNVGRQLRKLRADLGLSLRQLSEKVAVSPSTLQKIENNQISPTLSTMVKIAHGLDKDLQFFLESPPERTDIVFCPQGQRRRLDPPNVKFSIELLTEGLSDQRLSALLIRVPPRGRRSHPRHQGEELQHCLQGTLAAAIHGKHYRLKPGDTLHFKSDLPHSWSNVGEDEAVVLVICAPPLHVGRGTEVP
jgi:transcriptional regulator with XRE-family HTH domain